MFRPHVVARGWPTAATRALLGAPAPALTVFTRGLAKRRGKKGGGGGDKAGGKVNAQTVFFLRLSLLSPSL